ncbi:MAG: sulfite exporter TauE/SafE family protein, partial [Phycisphaerae bacterium]|nr:sulfite exporter TauE/SafE family protein [Phycisphaerae bacterium]
MPESEIQFWIVTGLIGLCGGLAGGLAGIGGSLVMLPGLAIFLGYRDATHSEQHVYQAAASAVNVLVTLPSVAAHARAGVIDRAWVRMLMPIVAASVVAGVLLSNVVEGTWLKRILAAAIGMYCVWNFVRVVRRTPERAQAGAARKNVLAMVGVASGTLSGLLGIG